MSVYGCVITLGPQAPSAVGGNEGLAAHSIAAAACASTVEVLDFQCHGPGGVSISLIYATVP
ncbi:MAG: hypothetical protein ACXVXO_08130 [Mycobacteriaceae bacterium]